MNIKDTFEEVEMLAKNREEVYENILREKKKLENNKKQARSHKKIIGLVASLCLIISSSVLAYRGIDLSFLNFLNRTNITRENLIGDLNIDEYTNHIDLKIEGERGNLYIRQAIMDENIIHLYMTLEDKQGQDFSKDRFYSFRNNSYRENQDGTRTLEEKGSQIDLETNELRVVLGNPKVIASQDNFIDLVFSYDMTEQIGEFNGFKNKRLNFSLKDFGYYKTVDKTLEDGQLVSLVSDDFIPLIEGTWEGDVKLGDKILPSRGYYLNRSKTYSLNQGQTVEVNFKDLELSNLGLKLKLANETRTDLDLITDLIFHHGKDAKGDIKLIDRTGKIIETRASILMGHSKGEGVSISRELEEAINLDEVVGLIIWGQRLDL